MDVIPSHGWALVFLAQVDSSRVSSWHRLTFPWASSCLCQYHQKAEGKFNRLKPQWTDTNIRMSGESQGILFFLLTCIRGPSTRDLTCEYRRMDLDLYRDLSKPRLLKKRPCRNTRQQFPIQLWTVIPWEILVWMSPSGQQTGMEDEPALVQNQEMELCCETKKWKYAVKHTNALSNLFL